MRTKKIFLALMAFCLVACLFVTSCAKDGGGSDGVSGVSTTSFSVPSTQDDKVAFTWTSSNEALKTCQFIKGGKSTLGNWGTSGGKLYFDGLGAPARMPYTVNDTTLVLDFTNVESGVPGTVILLNEALKGKKITFTKETETSSGTGGDGGSGSGS